MTDRTGEPGATPVARIPAGFQRQPSEASKNPTQNRSRFANGLLADGLIPLLALASQAPQYQVDPRGLPRRNEPVQHLPRLRHRHFTTQVNPVQKSAVLREKSWDFLPLGWSPSDPENVSRLSLPTPHATNSGIGLPWSTMGVGLPLKSSIVIFEESMPRWW